LENIMRAVRFNSWKSEPVIEDVPYPEPGPGEVVIKIGGAGLCHTDLHFINDFESGSVPFEPPFTLGHENAGWIHELGAGVHGWDIGQPVAVSGPWGCGRCPHCRKSEENLCDNFVSLGGLGGGSGRDGGMAEYLCVPSDRLLIPLNGLDPASAAPLTDAGVTPYRAVKRSLSLLVPGSTVVIIGAGGLGHLAIQIAKHLTPARVVAVDRNPKALALAADIGADATVLSDESVSEALVGSDSTLALAAATARAGGHITLGGIAGGTYPFGFLGSALEVAFAGSHWGSTTELVEVIHLAEQGHLNVHVEKVSMDDVLPTYARLAAGDIVGRAVMVP
jgi:propanol-preferring alcohol dehydrogenase